MALSEYQMSTHWTDVFISIKSSVRGLIYRPQGYNNIISSDYVYSLDRYILSCHDVVTYYGQHDSRTFN